MMKESKGMNNKIIHAYIQAAVNAMFPYMYAKKGIELFAERVLSVMIREFKQLDEATIPGKPVVIPLKPDEFTDPQSRQALEAVNVLKKK